MNEEALAYIVRFKKKFTRFYLFVEKDKRCLAPNNYQKHYDKFRPLL